MDLIRQNWSTPEGLTLKNLERKNGAAKSRKLKFLRNRTPRGEFMNFLTEKGAVAVRNFGNFREGVR